jgi:hypothetical protein
MGVEHGWHGRAAYPEDYRILPPMDFREVLDAAVEDIKKQDLQIVMFSKWAMLVSNQRPLPCESEAWSFAIVRRYPISAFSSRILR